MLQYYRRQVSFSFCCVFAMFGAVCFPCSALSRELEYVFIVVVLCHVTGVRWYAAHTFHASGTCFDVEGCRLQYSN